MLDRFRARPLLTGSAAALREHQLDDLPDAELAVLGGSGEVEVGRAAIDVLYRRYVERVYGYAFRRLGSREAAEDATSDVFREAVRSLPNYRPIAGTTFGSWLFAIAHHVIVRHARQQRPDVPLDVVGPVIDAAPTPEDLSLAAEEGRRIQALLAILTPRERQVMELELAGLRPREIADVLGLSAGAVHTARSRALDRLRSQLGVDRSPTEDCHATPIIRRP